MHTLTAARRSAALLLFAVLLTGCASSQRAPAENVYLLIDNRKPQMVTIHAMRHSSRYRIGMVQGLSTERFIIRPHMIGPGGEVRLAVAPLGDPSQQYTRSIFVHPGDTLRLELTF